MRKKRITFQAIPLIEKPKYEILINMAKTRRIIYDPQLSQFEFPYISEKHFSIPELEQLSTREINELVLLPHELPPLIAFCTHLPLLHVDQPHAAIPPQRAVVNVIIDNGGNSKPGLKKFNNLVRCEDLAEVNLQVARPTKSIYDIPTDICYTKTEKKAYTPPRVDIDYNIDLGKNEFYIFFTYLENGVFRSFKIKLDKINQLSDLELRRQKAAGLCEQIADQLYEGWNPQRIKASLGV